MNNHLPPRVELISIRELVEFNGWDSTAEMTDLAILTEYRHAWKDYFQKFTCQVQVNKETLRPSKEFCIRIGLPFRWYVRWSAAILEHFPQAWELRMKWLQNEVEYLWSEIKHVKVPKGADYTWEALKIMLTNK